jgi:hypothetical protein
LKVTKGRIRKGRKLQNVGKGRKFPWAFSSSKQCSKKKTKNVENLKSLKKLQHKII